MPENYVKQPTFIKDKADLHETINTTSGINTEEIYIF